MIVTYRQGKCLFRVCSFKISNLNDMINRNTMTPAYIVITTLELNVNYTLKYIKVKN